MKIDVNIPDGISGDYEVKTYIVKKNDDWISAMKTGRSVPEGTYKMLKRCDTVVMSNTPDEISDFYSFVHKATGSVLVNGLGLGVLLNALIAKPDITDITVVEISEDVIKLVAPYITDPRVKIVQSDCFTYESPKGKRYNAVWHDIWDYICEDNLEEMKKLHRKYGRKADYQESWARYLCEREAKQNKRNNRWW